MRKTRILFLILAVLIIVSLFAGCASYTRRDLSYTKVEEINGKTVGLIAGSVILADATEKYWPDSPVLYYNGGVDMALAIKQGIIEAGFEEEPIVRYIRNQTDNITYIPDYVADVEYALAFSKSPDGAKLCAQFNEFINKIKTDGTIRKIDEKWFGIDEAVQNVNYNNLTGENGNLTIAFDFSSPPFSYMKGYNYVGYDFDIFVRFCNEYGYNFTALNLDPTNAIAAVVSGKADVAGGCITVTDERAQSVLFSDPTYEGGLVAEIRSGNVIPDNVFEVLGNSFYNSFIKEDRYQLVIRGLLTTIQISMFSLLFGTLLGLALFIWQRKGNPFASGFCKVYTVIIKYLPVLIVLMILFYLVFNDSGVSGDWIAIIAFTVYFGANVYAILKGTDSKLNKSELDAAHVLGFTERQGFYTVMFPQIIVNSMEEYRDAFVALFLSTTIVGYVAVADLTRVSNIISGRTFDAFMPLIVTSAIYFVVSFAFAAIIKKINIKVDPFRRSRKKILKGIDEK